VTRSARPSVQPPQAGSAPAAAALLALTALLVMVNVPDPVLLGENERALSRLQKGQATLVQALVGPRGATLRLPDGASVTIPRGALIAPTAIRFREVARVPDESVPPGMVIVGKRYALEPDDAVLVRPVTLTLPYDIALVPDSAEEGAISIFVSARNGDLHLLANETGDGVRESAGQDVDRVRKTVTVSTSLTSVYILAVPGHLAR
jgi:hypothetical protein